MTFAHLLLASAVLVLSACVTPAPAPVAPAELMSFYRDADAYEKGASARLCADTALAPRLQALQGRLAAAREELVRRYGVTQVEAARVAVVTAGDACADRRAAANAIEGFERSVSNLEAALD